MKRSGSYVVASRRSSMHEQRARPRQPLELEVDLVHPDGGSSPGRTANIGLGGMFVRTSVEGLQSNDVVSAFLTIGARRCHVPALVMRVTAEGIGLMFARFDRDTLDLLGPLLASASSAEGMDRRADRRSASG